MMNVSEGVYPMEETPLQRALVMYSSGMTFRRATRYLKGNVGVDQIDVLKTLGADLPTTEIHVNEIYTTNQKSLSVRGIAPGTKNKLTANSYDFVVVLYNNTDDLTYLNVEKLALTVGGSEIIGLDYSLNTYSINSLRVLQRHLTRSLLHPVKDFFYFGILIFVVIPLLILENAVEKGADIPS